MERFFKKFGFVVFISAILFGMVSCNNGDDATNPIEDLVNPDKSDGVNDDDNNGGVEDEGGFVGIYLAAEAPSSVATSEKVIVSWAKPANADWQGLRISIEPTVEGWDATKIYKDESTGVISGFAAGQEYTFTLISVDNEGKDTDKKVVLTIKTPEPGEPAQVQKPEESGEGDDGNKQPVEKPDSSAEVDTTPCGNVSGLTADAGDSMVTLSWTNPTEKDLYGVEISVAGGEDSRSFVVKKDITSVKIGLLTNGTEYIFSVKTLDTSLNESEAETVSATPESSAVPDTTAPANVTGLKAESEVYGILLTWTDATDADIFGYEITYQKDASRALDAMGPGSIFVAPGTQKCFVADLEDGKTYNFIVKSMDVSGNKSGGVSTSQKYVKPDDEILKTILENGGTGGEFIDPEYYQIFGDTGIGGGYNVITGMYYNPGDAILDTPILNIDDPTIKKHIVKVRNSSGASKFGETTGKDENEYADNKLKNLDIPVEFATDNNIQLFKVDLGFDLDNITKTEMSKKHNKLYYTFYDYRYPYYYQLINIDLEKDLHPNFLKYVKAEDGQATADYRNSNPINYVEWAKAIIDTYGTHLVTGVQMGGRFEYNYILATDSAEELSALKNDLGIKFRFTLQKYIEGLNLDGFKYNNEVETKLSSSSFVKKFDTNIYGGADNLYAPTSYADASTDELQRLHGNWLNTLSGTGSAAIGLTKSGLKAIWDIIPNFENSSELRAELKKQYSEAVTASASN